MAAYPVRTHTPDLDSLPDSALLRLPAILAALPIGRSTWFGWVQSGYAPQPIRIGARAVAWKVGEIRAFMAGRARAAIDPNIVKATEAHMANAAKRKAEEAEKAARRALLI